jgi:glycosyltransferase involved in cell wall biosynthesis
MYLCHLTISPIDYERRIFNQIDTAAQVGHQVQVYALGRPGETRIEQREKFCLQRVFTVFYRGGPIKFISINLQLFFLLLFRKYDLIHCHDLWVLPAAACVAWLRRSVLIYDAHEYYAGLEIFQRKRFSRFLWLLTERIALRQVRVLLTVSEKLGERFRNRYSDLEQVQIIRNLPRYERADPNLVRLHLRKNEDKIIIYQGHFKPGRGLEKLIQAMVLTPARIKLHMIGNGELEPVLKNLVLAEHQEERIFFHDFIPTTELISTSAQGDLGVVLFEPSSLNYAAALPNKFFEYMMAGLPVLCSNIETFTCYIDKYQCGLCVDPDDITVLSQVITGMISDENRLKEWKANALKAAEELNWENEEKKLTQIYAQFRK